MAEKAGVALGTWSTGATFGDYDGDGRLDLFVAGYLHVSIVNIRPSPAPRPSVYSFLPISRRAGDVRPPRT